MKILNPRNLPESLVRAVTGDPEKRPNLERFGVNDLIGAPLPRYLKFKHWDELTDTVENRAWMMLGQAFHLLMDSLPFLSIIRAPLNKLRTVFTAISSLILPKNTGCKPRASPPPHWD